MDLERDPRPPPRSRRRRPRAPLAPALGAGRRAGGGGGDVLLAARRAVGLLLAPQEDGQPPRVVGVAGERVVPVGRAPRSVAVRGRLGRHSEGEGFRRHAIRRVYSLSGLLDEVVIL